MHRDFFGPAAESGRGLCSKRFLEELIEQGVGREEAVEAVAQVFGVARGAAELFVFSHPAWTGRDARADWPWWRAARG